MSESATAGSDESDMNDAWKDIHYLTQETRAKILEIIIGHEDVPSTTEVTEFVGVTKATASQHLFEMEEKGYLEEVELEKERRGRSMPKQFWKLTDRGEEILQNYGLMTPETCKHYSKNIDEWEMSEEAQVASDAPRPFGV